MGLAKLVIIGGGIGGLATALFLGRRGHSVTVFEAENRWPTGNLDGDFFDWQRPRVPQATQPHAFMAPVRTILRTEAPDVYASMLRLGAREYHEFDWFDGHPPARPGDEDLVTTRTRRILLETTLYEAVSRESSVELRSGATVDGLVFGTPGDVPLVTGVRCGAEVHHADLVLDIAGRRSPVSGWLAQAGCRPAVVENHRIGIAYFSRWYRLSPGAEPEPKRISEVSVTPFAIGLVFPSDNDIFGVTLAISASDPTRAALRDPEVFDSLAAIFPGPGAWLARSAKGIGDMQIMAGLDNRWTALVDDAGPVVTGLLGVGDSITHTNPTLGQGVALTLLAAQRVASTVDGLDDHVRFASEYHEWAVRTLKPWFDHQVTVDRGDEAFLSGTAGMPALDAAARAQFALNPCALEDPIVMRAKAQVRHLVLAPQIAFGSDEVREHVARWLDEHPEFPSMPPGPSRDDWLAITGQPAQLI
ncbi:NAD(P)/FAD-dependent oxidoreductase [Allorhizocola rhizosphaerae]|uniref:NAD(P)/FAD-dependent oxidoreductase n=1 Tax=Allorhizocola rhizosphaerae TaxID=1872709 RepID=UPI001B8C15DF|nr:FAD-dependent oxidoreductase [Allorhizocola rhizosphaerae]